MTHLCDEAKSKYYCGKITENQENTKTLFQISNSLLHKGKDNSLPTHSSEKDLADKFAKYFNEKILTIYENFVPSHNDETPVVVTGT